MIIRMDGNVWQKLAEFYERDDPRDGVIIIDRHFIDDSMFHAVQDMMGKLLGLAETESILHTNIDLIEPKQVEVAGFGSKETMKRTFAVCIGRQAREIGPITLARIRIVENERYWCSNPECYSVNLEFLKKNIHADQLPFLCLDCGREFYAPDKDMGSPRVKNDKLERRYCRSEAKYLPADELPVYAIAGERWLE